MIRRSILALLLAHLASLGCGCDREDGPPPDGFVRARPVPRSRPAPTDPEAESPVEPPAEPEGPAPSPGPPGLPGGTIEGSVVVGEASRPAEPAPDAHAVPLAVHPEGGVANAFVHVSSEVREESLPPPPRSFVLRSGRSQCFEPRVFGLQVKQRFSYEPSDGKLHNIHSLATKSRESSGSAGNRTRDAFTRPELAIKLRCEVHPEAAAWCHVLEHPFFAVSGAEGRFRIVDVPPGTHRLSVWHETLGVLRQDVEVRAGETSPVRFEYRPARR